MLSTTHLHEPDAPVIIAGAGPAGMCLAIDLAQAGIRSIMLETRAADARFAARTNLTNSRSMEYFRRWGMAERLRRNIPLGPEISRDIRFVTRANGHVIANFPNGAQFAERVPFASEVSLWGPQGAIERTIRERVTDFFEIDVRFESTVTDFSQDEDGVSVTYTDARGNAHQLRGRYFVGADGSRSFVRKQLGLKMEGSANLIYGFSWLMRSPELTEIMNRGVGMTAMTWFANLDRSSGILVPQDSDHRFQYFAAPVPTDVDGNNWDVVKARLFEDIGTSFDVEPISGSDLWIHSLVLPRFSEKRIFLIGDSAHLVSPFGGFGMNTAIGDSANLGWKLRAVIQGWGGERLLDTYDAERRKLFRWIQMLCEESTKHVGPAYVRPRMEDDTNEGAAIRAEIATDIVTAKTQEFVSIGAQLGYAYLDSPICVTTGAPHVPSTFGEYNPSSAAGARAPHVWLGSERSLYDAFGPGFTLLHIGDTCEELDIAPLVTEAKSRNMPLTILYSTHPDLPALYGAKLALIRPDQHVAWRGDVLPGNAGELLDIIRGA
ncbi:FAD-dependent monooxygenase [Cupriavidus necator]